MTGIQIVARLGSTRLPNKHLIMVNGKTFIEWLALRLRTAFHAFIENNEAQVIISTSENKENHQFKDIFEGTGVKIFFGSDENIPLRQLQCAEALELDNIISIDGDDILCSPAAAIVVLEQMMKGAPAAKTAGLPLGMNIMGYTTEYLRNALANQNSEKLETGWGRIFNSEMVEMPMDCLASDERLRFTLDYEQDAAFFGNVIGHFKEDILHVSDNNIIEYVLSNEVYKLNASLNEEYWQNFNLSKQAEL